MAIYEDVLAWMREQSEGRFANKRQMAQFLSADPSQLNYTLSGAKVPKADRLFEWLDSLGVRVSFPDKAMQDRAAREAVRETVREVCFVHPQRTSVPPDTPGPDPVDYLAVPLAAAPVAAGPGLIPEDKIRSWVLVYRHHESVRLRSNLVAVEIGSGERSMVPTLHPGDIVLVDRNDREPSPPGRIMLVTDPDGAAAIKRVSTKQRKGWTELIFYSDNAAVFPPDTYSLERDYEGELERAVAGRVVWAWADVTKK